MIEHFKEVMNTIINDELSKGVSPFSDPFFVTIIKPELEEELFCDLERDSAEEIQAWHKKCLRGSQE
jgi:hypothetical protein